MNMNLPVPKTTASALAKSRKLAIEKLEEAMASAVALFETGDELRKTCLPHNIFPSTSGFEFLFEPPRFDAEKSRASFIKELDAEIWRTLIDETGLKSLMDRQALDELRRSISEDMPEATEANMLATIEATLKSADLIFARGLVNCFSALDRRFKSHDAFKIGSRIIIERAVDSDGWFHGGRCWDTIADVERVMAVLDKESPDRNGLEQAVRKDRPGFGARQSETEARYFKIRIFKNGNAHLWFSRDDLVRKANKILAEHYGEVLPDAYAEGDGSHAFTGTDVAKDLQFYESPGQVVQELISGLGLEGAKVLEPSAGEGAIALAAARKGANVTAIEIDRDRLEKIRMQAHGARLSIECRAANFLTQDPRPIYDFVLMNPPFYGTHWMAHVEHAFRFLAPGGILKAVLPASAEVNETKKHIAFRKWIEPFKDYSWMGAFEALPEGSFKESGTNIQTVILHLRNRT